MEQKIYLHGMLAISISTMSQKSLFSLRYKIKLIYNNIIKLQFTFVSYNVNYNF